MFLHRKIRLLSIFAISALLWPTLSFAKDSEIAILAPLTGSNAIVGQQMQATIKNKTIIDDACEADKARIETEKAIENGVKILIGYPCIDALDAAADHIVKNKSDAIIITLGVQASDITDRKRRPEWPVYRFGPPVTQESETLANFIKKNWRDKPFAIIDDGTLYGRQLSENVLFLLNSDELKPFFTDTYRPLLEQQRSLIRRLEKAGTTHIVLGGDLYDAAIISRDAKALNVPLVIMGGSALRSSPQDGELSDGSLFIAQDENLGFGALSKIALTIARQALDYATVNKVSLHTALQARQYDTSIGEISFNDDGENNYQWFSVFEIQKGDAVKIPIAEK